MKHEREVKAFRELLKVIAPGINTEKKELKDLMHITDCAMLSAQFRIDNEQAKENSIIDTFGTRVEIGEHVRISTAFGELTGKLIRLKRIMITTSMVEDIESNNDLKTGKELRIETLGGVPTISTPKRVIACRISKYDLEAAGYKPE